MYSHPLQSMTVIHGLFALSISSDTTSFVIPAFGMVVPMEGKYTFGLGAFGVSGMGVDYRSNLYNNVTFSQYAFLKFAPTLAYTVNDKLSLGFALNINYAAMDYEAGSPAEVSHHGGTSFGSGFTLGALYEINNTTTFGFTYESQQWFDDFEFNTSSGKDKLKFNQPQSVAIGLGLRPKDDLRFAVDVVWISWSDTNGANQPKYTQNSSSATPWDLDWEDQTVYKIGVEYDLNEKIKLRGGYNYGKNPLNPNQPFENIAFSAVSEQHYTAGIEINLIKSLDVNIGLMYSPKDSVESASAAQFINSATSVMSQSSIDIGLAYKFD